jgi:molybdenum cofactor cytidylyltransferase
VNVTAVILAAGGSSRLGRPKQLVQFQGRSLLRRAAETACASRATEVLAVLGHDAPGMLGDLDGLRVRVLENPLWRDGIGSSIRHAIASISPVSEGALVMLCDQPRLTVGHLDALIDAFRRTPDRPVASAYGGSSGVPALFPRALFGELLLLKGDRGAKRVLLAHEEELVTLPWPDGTLDVDTAPDVSADL